MKRQHYSPPLIALVNLRAREAAAAGSRYFIFHFSFPAPLNPQAASSAPAARWRDPSQKRKRKLVQPAGTEEIKPRPPPSPPRRRRLPGRPPQNGRRKNDRIPPAPVRTPTTQPEIAPPVRARTKPPETAAARIPRRSQELGVEAVGRIAGVVEAENEKKLSPCQ